MNYSYFVFAVACRFALILAVYCDTRCPDSPDSRALCSTLSSEDAWTQESCENAECCWIDGPEPSCYEKECTLGYFGSHCQFQCSCLHDASCDRITGECESSACVDATWGVGCMLDNECTYNDDIGLHYVGKMDMANGNLSCISWTTQKLYKLPDFADKDIVHLSDVKSYCRNPRRSSKDRAFCFISRGRDNRRTAYCPIHSCPCPAGRFDVNCARECHCMDPDEQCDQLSGECVSQCHPHWTGLGCQQCAEGWFGGYCHQRCHCQDVNESCDNVTGTCSSGCAAGWSGQGCQTACSKDFFGIGCELQCRCSSPTEICNRVNGACPLSGCRTGFAGAACQIMLPTIVHPPSITTRTATSLTVGWRDWKAGAGRGSGPVVGYILYYKPLDSTQWLSTFHNVTRPFAISGLFSNQQYFVTVAAVHQSGAIGLPSPNVSEKTCGRPLSGPTSLKLTAVESVPDESGLPDDEEEVPDWTEPSDFPDDTTSLSVVWKMPPSRQVNCVSQQESRIYTRRSQDAEFVLIVNVSSGLVRSQLIDINPFVNLTVGVTIVNNAWLESDMIQDIYVGRSGPVEALDATAVSPTSLVISWSPPKTSNGIISFYLFSYRQLSQGGCPETPLDWSRAQRILSNQTETTLLDLSPFSTHEVKVIAKTSAGRGQVATVKGITGSKEPPSITDLQLSNLTSTAARFMWTPLVCQMYNGLFVGYEFQLTDLGSGDEKEKRVIANQVINRTEKYFPNLIPFTNYSFVLFFRNEKFSGPESMIKFMTIEDVPPPPRNFSVQSKLSDGLGVVWLKPQPPNGVLTQYTMRYRQSDVVDFIVVPLDASVHGYNITGLQPFTAYILQIQATTRAGSGAWSEQLECTTEESIPSEPLNFVNSSRTSTSATFHWLPPLRPNGLLRSFEIVCKPTNNRLSVVFNHTVSSSLQEFTITKLLPGLCYVCTLRAVNGKGHGPKATRLFWTVPVLSELNVGIRIDNLKIAETTVSIVLTPPAIPDSMEEADKIYRIVVEAGPVLRKRRALAISFDEPCGRSSNELVDFKTAEKQGVSCYVAAEIVVVTDEHLFIVGDDKTYGGYYNAPLKSDENYRIWFGLVVAVDGASAGSYSFIDALRQTPSIVTPEPQPVPEEPDQGSVAGIVVAVILVLVIAAVAVVFFLLWKKRQHLRNQRVLQNIYTDEPGTATKLVGRTETENNDDGDNESEYQQEITPFISGQRAAVSNAVKSRPIPVNELWSYVATKKLATDGGLKAEYLGIPSQLSCSADVAKKIENKPSNRYANIIAYDHSRVVLECSSSSESDYINANYVDGFLKPAAYVSTQGPSKATLNDFWRMIWQLKSSRIVMLCNLMEDGRRKCEQYWPDSGSNNYGEIHVESIDTETFADFRIRKFLVSKRGDKLTVMHFHFTAWPDHGVPTQPTSLLSFRRKFHSYDTGSVTGPVVVHCSAGVGRSGTFISLDYLLDQAKAEGNVDVLGCVYKMREFRVNMVQTPEQYLLLHDSLLEALATGDTAIPCTEFRQRYAYLQEINPATRKMRCLEEFESLESVSSQAIVSSGKIDGLSPENIEKNRSKDIVPQNRTCRPLLLTCNPGSTDYINAVFVDGYKQRDAFIVTQAPMPHTVIDFWTMIHDHSCRTIISLNDLNSADKTVGAYFPRESSVREVYGQFIVDLNFIDDKSDPSIIIREFKFSLSDQAEAAKTIRHFQFMSWPSSSSVPTSKSAMLTLLNLLEQWQQRSGNGVITIHCLDGATRSGVLCSLSYLLERLKAEQDVDVFHSVKHARVNRPQLVPTFDQYQFLCEMAIEYLDCFETYSNFK